MWLRKRLYVRFIKGERIMYAVIHEDDNTLGGVFETLDSAIFYVRNTMPAGTQYHVFRMELVLEYEE